MSHSPRDLPTRPPAPARRTSSFAVVVVLALVAVSCGRSSSTTNRSRTSTTTAGTGTSSHGRGDFGDLKKVCGPGTATGATDRGVTSDAIHVATFSDVGFVGRPGLDQELWDASKVFVSWCNAAGGINGRKIKLDLRDAALTEFKAKVLQSCQSDFAMVGGGAVFDDTGQQARLNCLLPDIPAYVVSAAARGADLVVQPIPVGLNQLPVGTYQYLGKKYPGSTSKVGYLTGNVPTLVQLDAQTRAALKIMGWKQAYAAQYSAIGEATWTPFAQSLATNGVKGLVYTGEPENAAKLFQALQQIGYHLDWITLGVNSLEEELLTQAGPALQHVYMTSQQVPFFEQSKNPATQQYTDLFKQYLPKGKSTAQLGLSSFSAWLLFATAAKACGADLTRRCLYDQTRKITVWTGGGLHAPTNPASGRASDCAMIVEGNDGKFFVPSDYKLNKGLFRCDPNSVATIPGNWGTGAKLADVGKTLADLP